MDKHAQERRLLKINSQLGKKPVVNSFVVQKSRSRRRVRFGSDKLHAIAMTAVIAVHDMMWLLTAAREEQKRAAHLTTGLYIVFSRSPMPVCRARIELCENSCCRNPTMGAALAR